MPRLIRHKETGEYYVQENDGAVRPAQAKDIGDAGVIDYGEMGVTTGERFVVKNFASNPAAARSYLRKKGYDVIQIGNSMNFAVRKPGEQGFKVLDPKGFGAGGSDFFFDMLDLVTDIGLGIGTGAAAGALGAATGGLGAAAGAAGAGAAGEFARQGIGGMLGLENNIDPAQAGLMGGLSAAVPVVGKVASGIVRPISRGVGQVADALVSRVSGVKPISGSTTRRTIEAARAFGQTTPKSQTTFKKPGEVLDAMQARLRDLRHREWIESAAKDDIITKHSGRRVDFARFRDKILELKNIDEGVVFADASRNKAISIMDDMIAGLGGDQRVKRVSLPVAERFRKMSADIIDAVNGWSKAPKNVKQRWISDFKGAYHGLREEMSKSLRGVGLADEFDDVMRTIHLKSRSLRFFEKQFGENVAPDIAEGRVVNSFKKMRGNYQREIKNFDQLFGDDWTLVLRRTGAASYVDPNPASFGSPGIMPPFTATGGIFGASAIGAGTLAGGAPGAAIGAALASPKVALGAHRLGTTMLPAMGRAAVSPTAQTAAITGLQATARNLYPRSKAKSHKPVVRMQ